MRFNDIRVGARLSACITGLMIAMLLVATITTFYMLSNMDKGQRQVREYDHRILTAVQWLGAAELTSERLVASLNTTDGDLAARYDREIEEGWKKIQELKTVISHTDLSDAEKQSVTRLSVAEKNVNDVAKKVADYSNSGDVTKLKESTEKELNPSLNNYLHSIAGFVKQEEEQREHLLENVDSRQKRDITIGLCGGLLLLLAGYVVARMISSSLTKPLKLAVDVAVKISNGDLVGDKTFSPSGRHDEFGQLQDALHLMSNGLNSLVSQVRSGVISVTTATSEIASGNHDLAARTEHMVGRLQVTAETMSEFSTAMSASADTARQASSLASQAATTATRGGTVMNNVVTRMTEISAASKKIADITAVIDGISFQTNILALNAAVEAARAGEQGRGFAVVASEVRTLAQRSAQAAREISELIAASLSTVAAGAEQVSHAGATMQEIVADVHKVRDLIEDMSTATHEQSVGIGQVNHALGELEGTTQQNAALVEEASAAAESLRDQAVMLTKLISFFKADDTSLPVTLQIG